jgi:hypothetical protein
MRLTKRRAAFRLRHLQDEFDFLMASFPDLHDAFDADELPLAFILQRDSRPTDTSTGPRKTPSVRAQHSFTQTRGTHNRRRRKQMSDE